MPEIKAFNNWYERSGVRSDPRRLVDIEDDIHKAFFPEHLIPHLGHPLVDSDDHNLRRYIAAQHLYQWLCFTTHFEVGVVCRATQLIADGSTGLSLTDTSRMNAYKIIVDESYHSLYSLDVQHQLEIRSGIKGLGYDFRPFIKGLDAISEDMPQHRLLVQLLQVVVFETLITSILSDIPKDESLIDIVRATVRDHAIDEGRHHAFFSTFFAHLWGQLDLSLRKLVAGYLPNIIVRSLQPPTLPAYNALVASGFSNKKAREIVSESYSSGAVLEGIRRSAAKTIQLFQQTGVLDVPGARESFLAEGLIVL